MLLLVVFSLLAPSHSFPAGAPAESCAAIYPLGHSGSSQALASSPFSLVSDVDASHGGTPYYIPGRSYTLTLSGSGGEQFRGFLVQARAVADSSPVGTFIDNGDDQALSSCSPPESAVTHPSRDLKSTVTFNWTAPSQDSGPVHIHFAVVGEFNHSIGSSIFWATAVTDTLLPCDPPLYTYQESCVEQCPSRHFGSSASRHCKPFPSDYILSLNATQYYAHLTSDTAVNTTVFYVQLSINLQAISLPAISALTFSLSQTQLVQELFEFENGDSENEFEALDHIQSDDSDTGTVDAAILLVALPEDVYYPLDLHLTIRVLLLYTNGSSVGNQLTTAEAIGSIVRAQGVCEFVDCQNGGICIDTISTHFTCQCPQGYAGATCNVVIDICQASRPCLNGNCTNIGGMSYTCSCDPGYTGQNCSEHVCERVDCNHGVCESAAWNTTCTCDAGYTGRHCDTEINNCTECSGNGNCTVDASLGVLYCECQPGVTGERCVTEVLHCSPNPCGNGGTCSEVGGEADCMCAPGWTGTYCETLLPNARSCNENRCFNNATCINCPPDKECLNGDFHCQCGPGFKGSTCSEDDPAINFCQSDSCANSGTCIEGYGQLVSCACSNEFTGADCAEPVDTGTNAEISCSNNLTVNENVIITIICAATTVIIIGIIGCLVAIVLIVRYQTKVRVVKEGLSRNLRRDVGESRVFSNTNSDTGIYFEANTTRATADRRSSPLLMTRESSLTLSSSPNSPPLPAPPLHQLASRHRLESSTSNGQWTRDSLDRCLPSVASRMTSLSGDTTSQTTTVSDYEQPVQSLQRFLQGPQPRTQRSLGQYEHVY